MISVRPATAADIPAIREIYNAAIAERIATADLEPRTVADREEWFRQFGPSFPLLVLEEGSEEGYRLLGYGGAAPYSNRAGYRWTAEIFVYVTRDARSRGVGKKLLAGTIEAAREAGIRYLHARIFAHNEPSLRIHRAAGFRDVGTLTRVAFLSEGPTSTDGQWIDVQLLELHP